MPHGIRRAELVKVGARLERRRRIVVEFNSPVKMRPREERGNTLRRPRRRADPRRRFYYAVRSSGGARRLIRRFRRSFARNRDGSRPRRAPRASGARRRRRSKSSATISRIRLTLRPVAAAIALFDSPARTRASTSHCAGVRRRSLRRSRASARADRPPRRMAQVRMHAHVVPRERVAVQHAEPRRGGDRAANIAVLARDLPSEAIMDLRVRLVTERFGEPALLDDPEHARRSPRRSSRPASSPRPGSRRARGRCRTARPHRRGSSQVSGQTSFASSPERSATAESNRGRAAIRSPL